MPEDEGVNSRKMGNTRGEHRMPAGRGAQAGDSRHVRQPTEWLLNAAVIALENVAFAALPIALRVEEVLDGKPPPAVREGFRARCLDLRNAAARECLAVLSLLVEALGGEDRIAA